MCIGGGISAQLHESEGTYRIHDHFNIMRERPEDAVPLIGTTPVRGSGAGQLSISSSAKRLRWSDGYVKPGNRAGSRSSRSGGSRMRVGRNRASWKM